MPQPNLQKTHDGETDMKNVLERKIAIITGAGSGMGLETAKLFHAEGAKVVLTDISGNEQNVAAELGENAVALTGDVSNATHVAAVVDLAVKRFGGVDVLANIAGIPGKMTPLHETTEETFEDLIAINLRGVFLTMKLALPHMIARGGGSIVNVASTAAIIGTPGLVAYAASKAGVAALTKGAAVEYGKHNIRVNAVCPGVIKTPMYDSGVADNPGVVEYLTSLIPLARIGAAGEIAHPLLFLASEASSYITGAILPIDGGQTTA
jgi:NAD(P)-dependent dehydrogenase (short-subunit alcohol dehydrogenase family)